MASFGNRLVALGGLGSVCLVGWLMLSPQERTNLGQASQVQADTPELRQRCYTAGVMHGDDSTSPDLIGIPAGPCLQSYNAGRRYFQTTQQQAKRSVGRLEDLLQSACLDGKKRITEAERTGELEQAQRLRALMPPECNQ